MCSASSLEVLLELLNLRCRPALGFCEIECVFKSGLKVAFQAFGTVDRGRGGTSHDMIRGLRHKQSGSWLNSPSRQL